MNKTMTLSFKTNPRQTNIRHNNRELTEKEFMSDAHKHIEREKSKYNIQIFKRDIKDVYHELFDDALNTYNAKQKRKDRKIDDYYKHVQKSKNLDLQREFIGTLIISTAEKRGGLQRGLSVHRLVALRKVLLKDFYAPGSIVPIIME